VFLVGAGIQRYGSLGVPVAGLDRLMLTEQPAVQDMMALADALLLPLMAKGIGPGDAVICPTFTFCATAEVVEPPVLPAPAATAEEAEIILRWLESP